MTNYLKSLEFSGTRWYNKRSWQAFRLFQDFPHLNHTELQAGFSGITDCLAGTAPVIVHHGNEPCSMIHHVLIADPVAVLAVGFGRAEQPVGTLQHAVERIAIAAAEVAPVRSRRLDAVEPQGRVFPPQLQHIARRPEVNAPGKAGNKVCIAIRDCFADLIIEHAFDHQKRLLPPIPHAGQLFRPVTGKAYCLFPYHEYPLCFHK